MNFNSFFFFCFVYIWNIGLFSAQPLRTDDILSFRIFPERVNKSVCVPKRQYGRIMTTGVDNAFLFYGYPASTNICHLAKAEPEERGGESKGRGFAI